MASPHERDTDWASLAVRQNDSAPPWPWPVSKWFIPTFWLLILLIACLAWFG